MKNRKADKDNLPIIFAVIASFLVLLLAFVYYADSGSDKITIFSQIGEFLRAIGNLFANLFK